MAKAKRKARRRKTFGEILADYRGERSLSSVAGSLGMTHAWLSHLETGRRTVRSEEDVRALAHALVVDPDDLLEDWRRLVEHGLRKTGGHRPSVVRRPPVPFPKAVNQEEDGTDPGHDDAIDHSGDIDGVDIGELIDAIRNEPIAREVARAICAAYASRRGREA